MVMKSVLISIKPKCCELIANGKKTVEVRKTKPKIDVPFKCYIYCTQEKHKIDALRILPNGRVEGWQIERANILGKYCNGKVIGEFVCDRIIDIPYSQYFVDYYHTMPQEDLEATCLCMGHIDEYLLSKDGFGWHISNLVIYDQPKELGEFFKIGHSKYREEEWKKRKELSKRIEEYNKITKSKAHLNTDTDFEKNLKMFSPFKVKRPPQSWCYVIERKFYD